jgi:prepilin-type N-terminal cleavage/methylation domain-containing protein
MKRALPKSVSPKSGFTLIEVLIALALAAVGFGVILNSVGLQMTLVSTSVERHQMLLYASEALETALARGTVGEEEIEEPIFRPGRDGKDDQQVPQFFYSISARPVTADPRVEQVTVNVKGSSGQVRLSAYRLRVRRDSGQ